MQNHFSSTAARIATPKASRFCRTGPIVAGFFCLAIARRPLSRVRRYLSSSPLFSTERNAFCGISTLPTMRMRFLPSFCFSRSLRLREMSPP